MRPTWLSGAARRERWPQAVGPATAAAVAALVALLAAACGIEAGALTATDPLVVAAAADLRPAFTELGDSFEAASDERVVFTFGSSGQLAQQLIEGAPMDLYASANVSFVNQVLDSGVGDPASQATYAFGRLVIWSRAEAWGGWDDLSELAADDGIRTVAIANPEHAPYGLAAEQALRAAGAWQAVEPRLVFGENVADAQRLAASGNADVAVIALSLALASDHANGAALADEAGEAGKGRWVFVDDRFHETLQQDLVVVAGDPDRAAAAQRFIDHVSSEEGRAVMRRFGFLLPGEDPPDTWGR